MEFYTDQKLVENLPTPSKTFGNVTVKGYFENAGLDNRTGKKEDHW